MKKAQYHELNSNSLQLHIHPLISFILGAAMATACILLYISANPGSNPSAGSNPNPLELSANWTGSSKPDSVDQGVTGEIKEEVLQMEAKEAASTGQGPNTTSQFITTSPAPQAYDPYKELVEVLKKAANEDNTVILTQINEAFAKPGSLLDLFLESFHAGENIERLLNHLVMVTMDQNAYDRCKSLHPHCYFMRTEGVYYNNEKTFMSKDYLDMMWGRNKFQLTILELGFNFLFTDVDVLWFRDPFRHISLAAHLAISSDVFLGDPDSVSNFPNGGFLYAKSCNKTIEFYRFWQEGRERFAGRNEQEVFNAIKSEAVSQMKVRFQFLDTAYCGGFCQLSKDLNKICTLHANCCVGLGNKIPDLRGALDDWKNFTTKSYDERRWGNFHWRVPGICIH
ncbi:nucleotide-diphospho-sugar transferase family protein [Rhynchospora pubera]|uniref:Nucleotide-diphospho-sugar transferase family protein n=1 Tax=Rhynchospora pubera TaxID=906938 RepID=A0AAV8G2R5_9POAL|nr:nucleotide-diphospho-sugar transferase family protein [Rhynchospora pubera]